MTKRLIFLLALFYETQNLSAQEEDPHVLLDQVTKTYGKIKDFTAQAEIIINVDFIKIPDKYATVYYKYPDEYRFKSKGFIMIPKKGLNLSITEIINQPATLVYSGRVEVEGRTSCDEIKIIPDDPKSDFVLASIFIDPGSHFILKMEVNTRKSGTYVVIMHYDQLDFPVPDELIIDFDVEKINFPLKFMGDVKVEDKQGKNSGEASVTIKYSEYKINQGIGEDVFSDSQR